MSDDDWGVDPTRDEAIAAILHLAPDLAPPSDPMQLPTCRWRPDLMAEDRVVHLALGTTIPNAYLTRIEAAAQIGYVVDVAVASTLHVTELRRLQAVGVGIIAFESPTSVKVFSSVADWIALSQIALDGATLADLGFDLLAVSTTSPVSGTRGRAFEQLLCLVFSQVSWLRVSHHGLHNLTEEIDVTMQVNAAGSLAQLAGGAVALATAKNEQAPAGSATVKYLKGQMINRRQRCQLGFLCAMKGISRKAREEINRGSETERLIVPLDRGALEELLRGADRLDLLIERRIHDATLA